MVRIFLYSVLELAISCRAFAVKHRKRDLGILELA